MQQKWRAPACYVGVAVICALYLLIVPGVLLTDVAAGAGIGAALMWAINEWETGKWTIVATAQPATAGAALVAPAEVTVVVNQAAPAPAMVTAPAATQTPAQPIVAQATAVEEPSARVDAGAATPATMEKWEIDEKEPSWDPSALAETWAKLRRELSINGSARPRVAPDLPRTAQLAKGPVLSKNAAPTSPATTKSPAPAAKPQPVAKPPLLAQQARLAAAHPKTTAYSPMASQQLAAGGLRKTATGTPAGASEPQRTAQAQPQPSFLRPSTSRPR